MDSAGPRGRLGGRPGSPRTGRGHGRGVTPGAPGRLTSSVMPPETVISAGFYVVFLLSVTLHEAAHAWSAHRLGDDTAYLGGQVTLAQLGVLTEKPQHAQTPLIMPRITLNTYQNLSERNPPFRCTLVSQNTVSAQTRKLPERGTAEPAAVQFENVHFLNQRIVGPTRRKAE